MREINITAKDPIKVVSADREKPYNCKIREFLGLKNDCEIISLNREYGVAAINVVSCAFYKYINENFSTESLSSYYEEEPLINLKSNTNSKMIGPSFGTFLLEGKGKMKGKKYVARIKLGQYTRPAGTIDILLPVNKLEEAEKIFKEMDTVIKSYTDLRLNGSGGFMPQIEKLNPEEIILPESIKRVIQNNIIDFINNKRNYENKLLCKCRNGIFSGPPGVGKSLTLKWIAQEVKANIIIATGEDIKRAENVRDLFGFGRLIKKTIIYIEDIDLLIPSRDMGCYYSAMLNELLNNLDGYQENGDITVICTANNANVLDSALLKRPGRFDIIVKFQNPDYKARKDLFKINLNKIQIDNIKTDELASLTEGFSCAQIVEVVKRVYLNDIDNPGNKLAINIKDLKNIITELKGQPKTIGFQNGDKT